MWYTLLTKLWPESETLLDRAFHPSASKHIPKPPSKTHGVNCVDWLTLSSDTCVCAVQRLHRPGSRAIDSCRAWPAASGWSTLAFKAPSGFDLELNVSVFGLDVRISLDFLLAWLMLATINLYDNTIPIIRVEKVVRSQCMCFDKYSRTFLPPGKPHGKCTSLSIAREDPSGWIHSVQIVRFPILLFNSVEHSQSINFSPCNEAFPSICFSSIDMGCSI